jgi:hypothetical protein
MGLVFHFGWALVFLKINVILDFDLHGYFLVEDLPPCHALGAGQGTSY